MRACVRACWVMGDPPISSYSSMSPGARASASSRARLFPLSDSRDEFRAKIRSKKGVTSSSVAFSGSPKLSIKRPSFTVNDPV